MRVGCQYERVRYSGWYNFMWNDPDIFILINSEAEVLQAIDPKNTTSSRDLLLLGADIRETVLHVHKNNSSTNLQ